MNAPAAATTSAQVRSQLVTALELDLIGPTQRVLRNLGADAQGLETEALDRLPSSWYSSGFLVPTSTDLSLRCDDTADDDPAADAADPDYDDDNGTSNDCGERRESARSTLQLLWYRKRRRPGLRFRRA